MEDEPIKPGTPVRVTNWAGPCLTSYTVVKRGRTRYKLSRSMGSRGIEVPTYEYFSMVHTEPCTRCTDHPQSHYPNGYEG